MKCLLKYRWVKLPRTRLPAGKGAMPFAEPGLPKELVRIPLEYFDPVFDWLAANPHTQGSDLFLHCMSKGGELGLLLTLMHPEIKKIAAFAPHAWSLGQYFSRVRKNR